MIKKLNIILMLLGIGCATSVSAANYTIGTGSTSGTYYPLGGKLAKIWSDNIPELNMRAEVTAASVENIIKVSSQKQLVGIAMGNVALKAYKGQKPFPRKMPSAKLFALYPNVVQFIVPADSSVHSISDLKGKKVSIGAPGSGTRVSATNILSTLGVSMSEIQAQSLNYTATTRAIANGQIDAGVIVGSLGVGAITELAVTQNIRILSFSEDELKKIEATLPAYLPFSAEEGSYKNVPAFQAPAVWNVLVVNEKMSDSMAYQLTKVAFDHIGDIRKTLDVGRFITVDNMNKLGGVPLHPGAQRYFDERRH